MAQLESIASLYLCLASLLGSSSAFVIHCVTIVVPVGSLGTKATCVYCDLHHASNLQKLGDSGTHLTCSIDVYYSSPDSIVSWPTENHSYEVHLLAYIFKLQLKTASACIVFKLLVHAPDNTWLHTVINPCVRDPVRSIVLVPVFISSSSPEFVYTMYKRRAAKVGESLEAMATQGHRKQEKTCPAKLP